MKQTNQPSKQKSFYLPTILVISAALLIISLSLIQLSMVQLRVTSRSQTKISALGVSEAGVNYYLWHLAHNHNDYTDGDLNSPPLQNGKYGPYEHEYTDTNGKVIGKYSLLITPPPVGGSTVTIESTGALTGRSQTRTVKAILGIPSFSQYSTVSNGELWFGENESTNGPVHSNVGVHMDGTNDGIVSAANATYVPTVPFGGNGQKSENGVWGNGGPISQWVFPVPPVNFQNITANLQELRTKAKSGGTYLPKSSNLGYFIQFQADGTYKFATVTNWSFTTLTTTTLISQPAPANGVIYAEDNVWVEGTIKGRYTVVAATLPSNPNTNRNIVITNNLTYTVKDGTDVLGLIAQKDIAIGPKSSDIMEIDASLLAQTGRVYRPCRWNDQSPCWKSNGNPSSDTYNTRTSLAVYGSIASFGLWTWNWVAGVSGTLKSGYLNTVQTYDSHLYYNPPPEFPSTGQYALLSWRELASP